MSDATKPAPLYGVILPDGNWRRNYAEGIALDVSEVRGVAEHVAGESGGSVVELVPRESAEAEVKRLTDELASVRSLLADHMAESGRFRGEALKRATERRAEYERVCDERDAMRSERDAARADRDGLRKDMACCLAWMRNDGWEPGMLESCDYRDTSGLAPGLVEWARGVAGETAGITEGGSD